MRQELTPERMRIGLAQMNSVSGDKDLNVGRAAELVKQAADDGANLVVVPEFFATEYFAQHRDYSYLDYAEPIDGPSLTELAKVAKSERIWVVGTILERNKPGFVYDSAVLLDPEGSIQGLYRKSHPAAVYSLEKIYFRFGSRFPVYDVGGWPVGLMICYDTFFPEVPRILALKGAELLVAPFAAPKHSIWKEMHTMRAFENGCFVSVCNKVGREDDWVFSGESLVVGPSGDLLAMASDQEEEVLVVELDRSLVEQSRRRYPMFRDRRPDLYDALVTPTEEL